MDEIYVVNRFDSDDEEDIVDYGEYYAIQNLTNASDLYQTLDTVQFTKPAGTFFYQGDPASKALPWTFSMTYELDGATLSASRLAGQSGALKITLNIAQGADMYEEFFDHFMLSVTITLDGDCCTNVVADGATVANSGKDKLLTYTVLPGSEHTYEITADVTEFKMDDISLNAVPMGIDLGDIDVSGITDELTQLKTGIQQIDSGAGELAGGASSLASGASELLAGMQTYSEGLDTLREGTSAMAEVSGSLRSAIDAILSALDGDYDVSGIQTLLETLLGTLTDFQDALSGYTSAVSTMASDASSLASSANSMSAFSQSDIDLLRTLLSRASSNSDVSTYLSSEIAALGRILDNAEDINSVIGTLRTQAATVSTEASAFSNDITAVNTAIQTALTGIRTAITSLGTLVGGLDGSYDTSVLESAAALIDGIDDDIQSLDSGVAQLQTGFDALYAGMVSLNTGAQALSSGAGTLYSGTNTLDDSTDDMDARVSEGVDEAIEEITGGEYEPISFVDDRNEVEAVQFVIKLPGVTISEEEEEEEEDAEEEAGDETFLDRLESLFE